MKQLWLHEVSYPDLCQKKQVISFTLHTAPQPNSFKHCENGGVKLVATQRSTNTIRLHYKLFAD